LSSAPLSRKLSYAGFLYLLHIEIKDKEREKGGLEPNKTTAKKCGGPLSIYLLYSIVQDHRRMILLTI
jgi:hypothetical protein